MARGQEEARCRIGAERELGSGIPQAGVAELVDALDSKSSSGDRVSVRFRPPAPSLNQMGILRTPSSADFCAANDVLPQRVAGCITNEVKDINRVVRDVTIKPTVKIRVGVTGDSVA